MKTRKGFTLLEMIVAIPLALLLSALAITIFATQLRATGAMQSAASNRSELEHSILAISSDIRSISAPDIQTLTQNSISAWTPVLIAIVCGIPSPNVLDLIWEDDDSPLSAVSKDIPEDGDLVFAQAPDISYGGVDLSVLDTMTTQAVITGSDIGTNSCENSSLKASDATTLRIVSGAFTSETPDIGSIVIIKRLVEWRAYENANHEWYLGRRSNSGGSWTTIQPVTGPLLPANERGFVLSALDEAGNVVASHNAKSVKVSVRMRRRGIPGTQIQDSLDVNVTLRGAGS